MRLTARQPASISVMLPVLMRCADRASVRLLRRALESALDQTYPDAFEILVVDDGSPVPVREVMEDSGMTEFPSIRWLRSDRSDGLSWRYRPVVSIPIEALEPLRHVLPDRGLYVVNGDERAPIRQVETLADGPSADSDHLAAERGEDVVVTCLS